MAATFPKTLGATEMARALGRTPRTLQLWVKDGADIKAKRSGHYDCLKTIAHAIGTTGGDEAAKRKAESEQERRDLDNQLREEKLRKERNEVIDFRDVMIWKKNYSARISKLHTSVRARAKRQFPNADSEIFDWYDAEFETIREACKEITADEAALYENDQ